jgi:hypothetical protein
MSQRGQSGEQQDFIGFDSALTPCEHTQGNQYVAMWATITIEGSRNIGVVEMLATSRRLKPLRS